jgi:hypothetical protein
MAEFDPKLPCRAPADRLPTGRTPRPALNELEGLGLEVEAVAALDEMAEAGPR